MSLLRDLHRDLRMRDKANQSIFKQQKLKAALTGAAWVTAAATTTSTRASVKRRVIVGRDDMRNEDGGVSVIGSWGKLLAQAHGFFFIYV